MDRFKKMQNRVIKEQQKQVEIINCVTFTALYQLGWTPDQIVDLFNDASAVWTECREKKISSFELLEDETEIELALDGERSWREFDQFTHKGRIVSDAEYIYSLSRRMRWIAPMILACVSVTLYRLHGYDYDELAEFLQKTDIIRKECGEDVKNYKNYMTEKTGFTPRIWEDR